MDFDFKPVLSEAMKNSDSGIDMDGEGFKSHKAGAPGKENSQVFIVMQNNTSLIDTYSFCDTGRFSCFVVLWLYRLIH